MKKVLFGTTAIAAAMTAGVAAADGHAGPKVDVKLTAIETFYIQDSAQNNVHETVLEDYYEFKIDASQQLEAFGGIEVGAEVEVRTTTPQSTGSAGFDADEQWSYVKGNFGMVYFGQTDAAAEKMFFQVTGGTDDENVGIGGVSGLPSAPAGNANGFTSAGVGNVFNDNTKIGYLSPKFADMVSFGVSWSPQLTDVNWLGGNTQASNTAGGLEDGLSAGVGLDTEFSGVGVKAALVYNTADLEATPALANAGTFDNEVAGSLELSVADFTFGGSYNVKEFENTTVNSGDETWAYTLGVDYAINGGQYVVGATYGAAEDERQGAGVSADEATYWQVGATTSLAPNVRLSAAYVYGDFDGATAADKGDASAFAVQTFFSF